MFQIKKMDDKYYIVFLRKLQVIYRVGTQIPALYENDSAYTTLRDFLFAEDVGLEQYQLNKLLKHLFNGVEGDKHAMEHIAFNNECDAKKALEWIESRYMIKKLSGGTSNETTYKNT